MASSSPKEAYEKYYDGESAYAGFFAHASPFYNDAVANPLRLLFNFFNSGNVKGDLQIVYGEADNLALILPGCGRFKKVIVIEFLDSRIQSFKNWLNKDPAAHDYSPTAKLVCELEGKSGNEAEKEESARNSIVDVIKGELTETHPVAPQLADQADCLTTSFSTEELSSDLNSFGAALKSMATLVKTGGYLIMDVLLGCSFVMVGEHKLPILSLTEGSVKKAVADAGFDISEFYTTPRLNDTLRDAIDFSNIMLLIAKKL